MPAEPAAQSFTAFDLETAACLWEAVLASRDRPIHEPIALMRAAAIRRACDTMGTAALRLTVVEWAPAVDADWRKVCNDYPLCFDWDFVPEWLDRHIDWSDPGNPCILEQSSADRGGNGNDSISGDTPISAQAPFPVGIVSDGIAPIHRSGFQVCSNLHLPRAEDEAIERLIRASPRNEGGRIAVRHPDLVIEPHLDGYFIHTSGAGWAVSERPTSISPALWAILSDAADQDVSWVSFDREVSPSSDLPVFPRAQAGQSGQSNSADGGDDESAEPFVRS